jgi:phospholipid transport system substrate-binding protein
MRRPLGGSEKEISMKRLLSRAAIIALTAGAILTGAFVSNSAQAASDPAATIKDFYATLTQTMKQGKTLGEKGRYDALSPAVRQGFDLGAMAQMAVGPGWAKLSPAERQEVTEAFARYTIATYAEHFGTNSSEKLAVGGAKPMPYGTVVETQIVDPNGDPTTVNYLMRQNGGQWQVADVYLQGTISQVANLRSQFSAVFQRGGAQELIEALNRKATSLNSAAS